ncbi:hypothetical protein GBA52_029177, partial [Prunus armeniaca]
AIKNARERDRRTLIRAMNAGKATGLAKAATDKDDKAGDLFPSASLEEYAEASRDDNDDDEEGEEEEDEDHSQFWTKIFPLLWKWKSAIFNPYEAVDSSFLYKCFMHRNPQMSFEFVLIEFHMRNCYKALLFFQVL